LDLFRKVRTLVGALAHKPFTSRPDKVPLDKPGDSSQDRGKEPDREMLNAQAPPVEDAERVADLIAQKRQEGADQAGAPKAR
jgi:hypothetical protein